MSKTVNGALTRNADSRCALRAMLVLVSVAALTGCGAGSANLRADNAGRLAPCDGGPHCVSSLAKDPDRRVAPLTYSGSRQVARQRLEQVIAAMPGAAIVDQQPDYIHATYTSRIMKFVDDVEFVLPQDSHDIQVRSSSRIGYYDFGVNRARVEEIRKRFEAAGG